MVDINVNDVVKIVAWSSSVIYLAKQCENAKMRSQVIDKSKEIQELAEMIRSLGQEYFKQLKNDFEGGG